MNTYNVNPLGFAYTDVTGVKDFAKPSAIIVTGRGNRYDQAFQDAHSAGAEVLAYLIPIEMQMTQNPIDIGFFMGDYTKVPLWGKGRLSNNFPMTDIRVGSVWADWVVEYVGNLITENKVGGAFIDVLGFRPWSKTVEWDNWPTEEKAEWTNGAVDLARRIHEKRMELNPNFKIIHNNIWGPNSLLPYQGDQYCNGVCIEHHPALANGAASWHAKYVNRQFAKDLPRRVLAIAMNTLDAKAWAESQGTTHVCAQTSYSKVVSPLVPYVDLRTKETDVYIKYLQAELAKAESRIADLMMENSVLTDNTIEAEAQLERTQLELGKALTKISSAVSILNV